MSALMKNENLAGTQEMLVSLTLGRAPSWPLDFPPSPGLGVSYQPPSSTETASPTQVPHELNNVQLIKLCAAQTGHAAAWDEFVARFHGSIKLGVYREACRKGLPRRVLDFGNVYDDLVQDVYLKLVSVDCKALKDFQGSSENSIFLYLGVIARNVVRNHLTGLCAQKRAASELSLNGPAAGNSDPDAATLEEETPSQQFDMEGQLREKVLREQVENILDRAVQGRNRSRDIFIMKLALYEGFSSEEIANHFNVGLSSKGVANLVSRIKRILQEQLTADLKSRRPSGSHGRCLSSPGSCGREPGL